MSVPAERTYSLSGVLYGPIWMPCTEAAKSVTRTFRINREADSLARDEFDGLRGVFEDITRDGDFQFCRLAGPTLTITDRKGGRVSSRSIRLTGSLDGSSDYIIPFESDEYFEAMDCAYGSEL